MIQCERCDFSYMTTKHETLESCPNCDAQHWRIYRVMPNRKPMHRLAQAIRQSNRRCRGRVFLTPKGFVVEMLQWRKYKKVEEKKRFQFRAQAVR